MELLQRVNGDELLQAGRMAQLRSRLRIESRRHDLTSVIVNAFDHRTRMLPFLYADMRMAPAGVREIGSAMVDAGFPKTRIILQQWNRNFRPAQMRLDGRIPDLFMVSSMLLHAERCVDLIRDACRIDPADRPLIIAGGPNVIYGPWNVFGAQPEDPWGADVAVTGESYVLLELLEVLLSMRSEGEPMRSAFKRARDSGALDSVPGLVYARTDNKGRIEELVDTGVQRLLGDLDELPNPVLGYELLEPPSRLASLSPAALPADRVRKHCRIASIVMTQGCKFHCEYCPIPAYNQRKLRGKSGQRIADEIEQIYSKFDIRMFFGSDDNFFSDKQRALDICQTIARRVDAGSRPLCKVRWGTEATIHDTLAVKEHLPEVRKAGLWALWLGVEDVTGTLVKKGQDKNKTLDAFRLLRQNGIFPIPMMMHHDSQPAISLRTNKGLINQLRILRKAGAVYTQVLMLTPSPGSKSYEESYTSGLAFQRAGGKEVKPWHTSGAYVIASRHPRPWIKQLNLIAAYVYFFNPLRMLTALVLPKTCIPHADAETWPPLSHFPDGRRKTKLTRRIRRKLGVWLADALVQAAGMWGLLYTIPPMLGWTARLMRGPITRCKQPPASQLPMRSVDGTSANRDLADTRAKKVA